MNILPHRIQTRSLLRSLSLLASVASRQIWTKPDRRRKGWLNQKINSLCLHKSLAAMKRNNDKKKNVKSAKKRRISVQLLCLNTVQYILLKTHSKTYCDDHNMPATLQYTRTHSCTDVTTRKHSSMNSTLTLVFS